MTSKADADTWRTKKRLNRYGFDADPNSTRIDAHETPEHVACRYLCGLVLAKAGRAFDTEVVVNQETGDRVDVVDFGDLEEPPLAIEFESAPDQPTIDSKLDRYVFNGPCRDLILFDLRECPIELEAIVEWIQTQLAV